MITKYQMISALAEDTARQVAKNGQEWTSYLPQGSTNIRSMSRCSFMHKDRMRQPVLPLRYGMKK